MVRLLVFAVMLISPALRGGDIGPQRVVFGTSVTGTADLGSWPDAGMTTGTAAADAICRARAQAAGLPNSTNYVAWLSDSGDDAYCRIHGFGDIKDNNCGQGQLPVAAGPWQRTDGAPLAAEIDQWLEPNRVMYTAIQFDEFGDQLPAFSLFFTATDGNGRLFGASTCSDWTDGEEGSMATVGTERRSSASWTVSGSIGCEFPDGRLICIETGIGPALQFPEVEGSLVFATDAFGGGDLGSWADAGGQTGIAAGDAICQAEAAAAQLPAPGSFVAWLSDSSVSALDRLTQAGPWVRLDGIPLAQSTVDLTDNLLFAPINLTASGEYISNWAAWTGTLAGGSSSGSNCDDWTSASNAFDGEYGTTNDVRGWTDPSEGSCEFISGRLYCFSNSPAGLLFTHGYEDDDG